MLKLKLLAPVILIIVLCGCKSSTQNKILGKWKYIDIANPYNMDSIEIIWDFYDGQHLRITRKNTISPTAPVITTDFEYSIPAYDRINIWSSSSSENVEIYFIRTLNREVLRIQKMEGNSVAVTHEFIRLQTN